MKPNIHCITPLAILLLGSMALLASCEKDGNYLHTSTDPTGKMCALLPPTVVAEPFVDHVSATRSGESPTEQEQVLSISDDMVNTAILGSDTPRADVNPQTRATEAPLADGIYYYIVIYKEEDWGVGKSMAITAQRLCKTGSTDFYKKDGTTATVDNTPIYLKEGNYKAFCFSNNNPDPGYISPMTEGTTDFYTTAGVDLMTATVSFTVSATDETVALPTISFKHMCYKLSVTLKAEDFSDNTLESTTPFFGYRGTGYGDGNWNIVTGALTGITAMGPTTVGGISNFVLNDSKTEYTGFELLMPFPNLTLLVSYEFKPTGASAPAKGTLLNLTSGPADYQAGTNVSVIIKAMGVYQLATSYPAIGGVQWGTSNLDRTKTFEAQPWISGFYDGASYPPESGTTTSDDAKNDYWRWNVAEVEMTTGFPPLPSSGTTWEISKDPCRLGQGGTWRVPSKANYESLYNARLANKYVKINGETPHKTNEDGFVEGQSTRAPGFVCATSLNNALFLPAAGYRVGNEFQDVGTCCCYWSNTYVVDEWGGTELANLFSIDKIYNNSGIIGRYREAASSIRCVRDPIPTSAEVENPGGEGSWGSEDNTFEDFLIEK